MNKFQFALQPVRDFRAQKEQSVRERYAAALRACEEAALHVQAAKADLTRGWNNLREKVTAGIAAQDLSSLRAWCGFLENNFKERTAAFEQAKKAAEMVSKELIAATRDRESIDKVHDKYQQSHRQEEQRQNQKTLDELAIQLGMSPLRLIRPSTA